MRMRETYDVIVCGGGLSGLAAAMRLHAAGVSCLVLEPRSALGWEITRAGRTGWRTPRSKTAADFAERMSACGGLRDGRLDPPVAEIILDEMAGEAGVPLLLHARAVDVVRVDGALAGVRVAAKAREFLVGARAIVDASPNALLWRRAGGTLAPPETRSASFTVFFINCENPPREVASLGGAMGFIHMCLKPGAWPGDVVLEYAVHQPSLTIARMALPNVLRGLRETRSELTGGRVTHAAMEMYPLDFGVAEADGFQAPDGRPVFGAAPWITPRKITPALGGLFDLGEDAADAVLAALPNLPPCPDLPPVSPDETPAARDVDVVVAGGGTAGALAAIAAGREGARTLVLEQGACLGGIGSAGGINSYYCGVGGGLQDAVDARVEDLTPLFCGDEAQRGFHPEAKKVVLEAMAFEADVDVRYQTTLTRVDTEPLATRLPAAPASRPGVRVVGLAAAGPEGAEAWKTSVVIDSTGDGDAAALAGAPFAFGREKDGLPHAYSLSAGMYRPDRGQHGANFDAGYCDPTDVEDMTRARRRALTFYRKETYDDESRLLYMSPLLGLRQARQVLGDYTLTLADEIEGREFPDVIAYAKAHYDNHGRDYEFESDAACFYVWALGQWRRPIGCEVPYRCLLPRNVEGMLVACRAISLTQDAHHQLRMQNDMQRLGEAAGVAAAMAVKASVPPRHIDIRELQAKLVASGALGRPEPKPLPSPEGAGRALHEASWKPPPPMGGSASGLVSQLGGEAMPDAAWRLLQKGPEARHALLAALGSDNSQERFAAAAVLAAMKRDEGAAELRRLLRARDETGAEPWTPPRWFACIPLLRMAGAREALPDLIAVVEDPETPIDPFLAALQALGELGDASTVAVIEAVLDRDDLPTERLLKGSNVVAKVTEDSRWQIDLTAARALAKLGVLRPDLAEKHLEDERVLVRRCAQRVLDELRKG